jgi:hypothetical protein
VIYILDYEFRLRVGHLNKSNGTFNLRPDHDSDNVFWDVKLTNWQKSQTYHDFSSVEIRLQVPQSSRDSDKSAKLKDQL